MVNSSTSHQNHSSEFFVSMGYYCEAARSMVKNSIRVQHAIGKLIVQIHATVRTVFIDKHEFAPTPYKKLCT